MDETIVRLGFAVVLLIVTLYVALGFLAIPLMILRKAGVLRVVRWTIRKSWRAFVGLLQFAKRIFNPAVGVGRGEHCRWDARSCVCSSSDHSGVNAMRLHNAMIALQSHLVLDNYGSEAVAFQRRIETKLEEIGDPNISWEMDSADVGFVRGLAGVRREFLVVRHRKFGEYAVLFSTRAHGTALHAAWLVMTSPRLSSGLRRMVRRDDASESRLSIAAELDLFDCMDLEAFLGVTRLAFKYAGREVTGDKADDDPLMLAFHASE